METVELSESGCVLLLVYFFSCVLQLILNPCKFEWPVCIPYTPYTVLCVINRYLSQTFRILFCKVCHSSLFAPFSISFLRYSEEEHFRGVHLVSSRRPPCTLRSLRVSHQEIICEEPDLPGLGIP